MTVADWKTRFDAVYVTDLAGFVSNHRTMEAVAAMARFDLANLQPVIEEFASTGGTWQRSVYFATCANNLTAGFSSTSAGVVNAASYAPGVAPAAWISVFGSNLAPATAVAIDSDLVNGYLPTSLASTRVTINGKPAYLHFVSATQINLQAPDDSMTGAVTLTVSTPGGSSSATVTIRAVSPGLFTTSDSYVLAIRPADRVIINGSGAAYPGYTTEAAAKPGDLLEIYATGLGATTPAVASGLVFAGACSTNSSPKVTIGGTEAPVSYSGLVGAGLYQINVTVPATLSSGTFSVVVMQNGVNSPATALLKVAK